MRTYQGQGDIAGWLALRNRVFLPAGGGGRPWDERDFAREFLAKPWWRPEWLWFAEAGEPAEVVGVVGMGLAARSQQTAATVQWLAVTPERRREGVARRLMEALETAAWEIGCSKVTAETLAAWDAAAHFYRSRGYEED